MLLFYAVFRFILYLLGNKRYKMLRVIHLFKNK